MKSHLPWIITKYCFAICSITLTASIWGSPASAVETPKYQVQTDEAYNQVHEVLAELELSAEPCTGVDSGYSSIVASPQDNSFIIYWKGAFPPSLVAKLKAFPEVRIAVIQASYSWCEMQAAIRVANDADSEHIIREIGPRTDGNGIDIGFTPGTSVPKQEVSLQIIEGKSNVHAINEGIASEVQPTSSRQADSSPWQGGAGLQIGSQFIYCSTATGVWSISNNVAYLLTASHCAEQAGLGTNHQVRTGNGQTVVGNLDATNSGYYKSDYDVAVVKPSSGFVNTNMYHGGYLATSTLTLLGTTTSLIGDPVCTNGANSGKHCNVTVQQKGLSVTIGNYKRYAVVRAVANDGNSAILAEGDSGGPVFTQVGTSSYFLSGVVSGSSTNVQCPPGFYYFGSPNCSSDVYFIDANTALNAIHMHM